VTTIDGFRGELIEPGDPAFDRARLVFNRLVDRRPALIARCLGTADVVAAVRHATDAGLPVGIRGGGHSVAGHGTCEGGVLVDLSPMRGVHVDQADNTAWIEGGATLGDVDHETQLYGLALPSGQVSKTGIAGLTLNGGMGMLQRKYGLTCDNLIEARVVTADGALVTASESNNPDLLWALRGGGGNFGVVTSFRFQLHPVGPPMLAGLVAWPVDRAAEVLAFLRDLIADAPEELSADGIFLVAPPLEFIAEDLHGSNLVGIFIRWCGDVDRGFEVIRPIQAFGPPVVDFVGPMPLVEVQSLLDPMNPEGNLHYWTGEFLPRFGPAEIDAVSRIGAGLPTHSSIVQVIPFNAAVTRVHPDATAFAHRDDSWLIHVLGQWQDPADTTRCMAWAREGRADLAAIGSGDAYLNLITDDEQTDRVRAFWDDSRMRRLGRVKFRYDPDNTFRFNHNIKPDASLS
jgi:FAD/FMN-containing dehydrogenase